MTGTEAADRQPPPRSRLTLEVVLDVEPGHFYRRALEAVREEDPGLAALLPPVPEGASPADVLDEWLWGDEQPGDERAREAQHALLAALESAVVVAVVDCLGDEDAAVGIRLEAAWDEGDEPEGDEPAEGSVGGLDHGHGPPPGGRGGAAAATG